MRLVRAIVGTALAAAAVAVLPTPAAALPTLDSIALNGTYRATSDGQRAQTNYAFHEEASVTSTWTITSTCSTVMDCTGKVTSDQGWSANMRLVGGDMWFVVHDVQNWERCQDGSTAPGHQTFKFGSDENLSGWDDTVGPSGACGANHWLVIEMPFKLVKVA